MATSTLTLIHAMSQSQRTRNFIQREHDICDPLGGHALGGAHDNEMATITTSEAKLLNSKLQVLRRDRHAKCSL